MGKTFTLNHFKAEQVPRSTLYIILDRIDRFPAKRRQGGGKKNKKMSKRLANQLKRAFDDKDKMSQRQAGKKFNIS